MFFWIATALAAPRLVLEASVPITGLGFSSTSGFQLSLDCIPISAELLVHPRVGLKLAADLPWALGGILDPMDTELFFEVPVYLGDRAGTDGMRGFFVGPYGAWELDRPYPGGGATLGYASWIAPRWRFRIGGHVGVGYVGPAGRPSPELEITALEVGFFLW